MFNLYVALTLREFPPDSTAQGRQIQGYFQFLTSDRMAVVGPEMTTELYDWKYWFEWLSHDLEESNLLQTSGMLHPGATVDLGPVHLCMPKHTPFYLAGEDD
jgi:hypothetical protein